MKFIKKVSLIVFLFSLFFVFSKRTYALENGIYEIQSSVDNNYKISINGTINNEASITLNKTSSNIHSKFYIKQNNNGYYSITLLDDDSYSIDVPGGRKNSCQYLQLYKYNGTDAQQWQLKDLGSGYYNIISKGSNVALDIKFGEIKDNNQIWLYYLNNSNAQKFKIVKTNKNEKAIDSGTYAIKSYDESLAFDIPGGKVVNENSVHLYEYNNTSTQQWDVKYLENGYYSIKPHINNKYSLDVPGGKKNSGVDIQLYKSNETNAQQWIIKQSSDGYFNIISKNSNLALDVKYGVFENGSKIWQYDYNNSNAQKFKFIKGEIKYEKTIEDGTYFINTILNQKKSIDVGGGRMELNNNVQLYDLNYSLAQKWDIKYVDNGYYKILCNKDNNYSLTVTNNNVDIDKYSKSDNQLWAIYKTDSNYYIISKNGYYMSLEKNSTSNENNILVTKYTGSNIQKFIFKKTASGISEKLIDNGIYRIVSSYDNNLVVDLAGSSSKNGANIQLYKTNGTQAQKWRFEYLSNGYYKITSLYDSNKSLDMAGGKIAPGANIQSYDSNDTQAQQWILKDAGDGNYYIVSNCGGLYMDIGGGTIKSEANIQLYTGNNSNAQKFKLLKVDKTSRVIDVSVHQGKIDWNKVANSGIYGVILRIGYWNTQDSKFEYNISEVKRLGIPYGIYLFSYANTLNGVNVEAEFTKSIINKYNLKPSLGIYYDFEDWLISADNTSTTLTRSDYDNFARSYINNVSSYVGGKYKVKIYADKNHADNRFGSYARSQVDWIAQYASKCTYTGSYSMWQYTSSATVDGINGNVDMSYLY